MNATLEICVDSLDSALAAQAGGADRIELCAALSEGGITPSLGFLHAARAQLNVPIYVMIRPRLGDFLYSDAELAVMLDDLRNAHEAGADGAVFGALDESANIHAEHTVRLLEAAHPLDVTFHRAFDLTPDLNESLQTLTRLGTPRVLTSGGEATALDGRAQLQELARLAGDRISVMAGGGVREHNVERLARCGIREFHSGVARHQPSRISNRNSKICFGTQDPVREVVHQDDVRALRTALLGLP